MQMKYFLPFFLIFTFHYTSGFCGTLTEPDKLFVAPDPIVAFSAGGVDAQVESVKEITTDPLNTYLVKSRKQKEEWVNNFIQIALHLPGISLSGTHQSLSVDIKPYNWGEEGVLLESARITIVNGGWLDDSSIGERFLIWITPDENGLLTVRRVLWAGLCSRPHRTFYSGNPCP